MDVIHYFLRLLFLLVLYQKDLKTHGQVFVGIDVIGDYLTEINVTSPTGIQELELFDEVNIAEKIWLSIEEKGR